jgi:hypothetical protein
MIVRLSDEDSSFLEFYAVSCLMMVRLSDEIRVFWNFTPYRPVNLNVSL